MFGRSKKADNPKKSRRSSGGLAQYGLIDIPDIDNFNNMNNVDGGNDENDDEDEAALEAELLALTSESHVPRKQKKPSVPVPSAHLDRMVADSLRDAPSDDSVSGDEDDPALLEELTELVSDEEENKVSNNKPSSQPEIISPVLEPRKELFPQPTPGAGLETLLNERIAMYKQAEANAKANGESARVRRFSRGVKTLGDLLKQVKAGKSIDEGEIPPPVAVQLTKKSSPVEQPESDVPSSPPPSMPAPPPPVPPRAARSPSVPQRPAPPPPPAPMAVPLPGLVARSDADMPSDTRPSVDEETDKHTDIETLKCLEPTSTEDDLREKEEEKRKLLALLGNRRDEYKLAAVKAKRSGNVETALQYIKIVKQFDSVISAVSEGKPVDLSAMPPPPPVGEEIADKVVNEHITPVIPVEKKEEQEKQRSCEPPAVQTSDPVEAASAPEEQEEEEEEEVYQVVPSSVAEALEQRLKVYQSQEEAAREAGNLSKARRMGRIVKQYQDAIKLHKLGKQIPVDELPTPPGFAPIPVETREPPNRGAVPPSPKESPGPRPAPSPSSVAPPKPSNPAPTSLPSQSPNTGISDAATDKATQKINARRGPIERQMSFLTSRQKEFRLAALEAKQKGELNQAKEYLRLAKGFEPLLDAASSGLPIDMDSVPLPPSSKQLLESDFDVITANDCDPNNTDSEIFNKLESDLTAQLKMCMQTRNHFKAIGDVASANRFEQLALHSKKDLDALRVAHKRNEPVPRFHYETKSFSIVQCNTDLTDNDLELTFVQGVNYNVPNPKEVDTYIKFEFPYPSDDPPKDKTTVVYNTNNPEYNATFPLTIHRNSRACQRVFKRHSIKCEVWSKGGFFRYDSLIGTASVKLQPLETKCTLHDSFDLMDGRKTVGGKLEVKVRIRNPILTKQVEQVQEKWLVIDH